MDEGKILLVNLSQGLLGEDNAALLGAMLITKIQLAAMARVHIPEEQRRDFYLYVDEFQNFATTSFNKILSEARKYRLDLILANQYIAQIPEEVQHAIFGNCGSIVSFVMGSADAQVFSREFGEKYTYDDLVSLNRHQIINRISIDNILSHPFPAYTLPLAASSNHNRDKVIRVSRERYATKKEDYVVGAGRQSQSASATKKPNYNNNHSQAKPAQAPIPMTPPPTNPAAAKPSVETNTAVTPPNSPSLPTNQKQTEKNQGQQMPQNRPQTTSPLLTQPTTTTLKQAAVSNQPVSNPTNLTAQHSAPPTTQSPPPRPKHKHKRHRHRQAQNFNPNAPAPSTSTV
jgi:hypothetical protein